MTGSRREQGRSEESGRAIERPANRLYGALLRLLPADLRTNWGAEMASTFKAEQRRVLDERRARVIGFWLREFAGLIAVAARARRPGGWARRTLPGASGPSWNQEGKGRRIVHQLLADIRFSARAFARRPAMTALAVASLALGIGASTAMFSVVDTVLLRPLPFADPHEIVSIYPTSPGMRGHPTLGGMAERGTYSMPEFWWVAERQGAFDAVGAFIAWGGATMAGDGVTPEQLNWLRATPGLLPALGTQALRGRLFGEEDDPRNGARSVMLVERFWQTRFAADPDIVGQTIRLNDVAYTVIGILPDEVAHATATVDVWVLLTGDSQQGNWGNHSVSGALGRLRDGVTAERARADLAQLMASVPPEHAHEHGASVFPNLEDRTRGVRPALTALIGAALLLLAVACGNVAALLIGVGIDREQEISVRSALGAGRHRLTRQFLTESLVLTGAGAAAGVLVAFGLGEALVHLAPPGVPRLELAGLDGRALLFTTAISALAGIGFGMIPALYLSRPESNPSIRSARGTTRGRGRLQALVVVGELAMATVLLVSAALLTRTLFALNRVDLGIDTEGLYEVRLAPQFQRFGDLADRSERIAAVDGYFQRLVDAVASIPGVTSIAVTDNVPLTGDRSNNDVVPDGWDPQAQDGNLVAERRFVSDNFFRTTRIRLVEGRGFEPADNHANAAPVMIISEGLARRAWPNEAAVGKQIRFWGREPATVVGVAANLRDQDLESVTSYAFYVPARQVAEQVGALLIRVQGDPTRVLAEIRPRVWSVDPNVPVTRITSFDELLSSAVGEQRFRARLMVMFAGLAALFALLGVYGVTARFVARRTREMGIRTALGADRRHVVSLVLGKGMRLAFLGAAAGLVASIAAVRLLEELLFGVSATDPASLITIAILVASSSLIASLSPAWRAARVQPVEALRTE